MNQTSRLLLDLMQTIPQRFIRLFRILTIILDRLRLRVRLLGRDFIWESRNIEVGARRLVPLLVWGAR